MLIKNKKEIEKMKISGKITSDTLQMISKYISPDISTYDIDQICLQYITKKKHAIPACLGYQGFPNSVCISINDVICHGIPNKKIFLKNGDIVNIDIAVIKNGYYSDASRMYFVGNVSKENQLLCNVTQQSLYKAISIVKPGILLKNIGKTIQKYVKLYNFSIVKEYCGHGIGKNFHELPQVLHYKNIENNFFLQEGMTFTIEPMINAGTHNTKLMKDGWTVKTQDGKNSAQYEHTLAVTKNGCEILTWQKDEKISPIIIHS